MRLLGTTRRDNQTPVAVIHPYAMLRAVSRIAWLMGNSIWQSIVRSRYHGGLYANACGY